MDLKTPEEAWEAFTYRVGSSPSFPQPGTHQYRVLKDSFFAGMTSLIRMLMEAPDDPIGREEFFRVVLDDLHTYARIVHRR